MKAKNLGRLSLENINVYISNIFKSLLVLIWSTWFTNILLSYDPNLKLILALISVNLKQLKQLIEESNCNDDDDDDDDEEEEEWELDQPLWSSGGTEIVDVGSEILDVQSSDDDKLPSANDNQSCCGVQVILVVVKKTFKYLCTSVVLLPASELLPFYKIPVFNILILYPFNTLLIVFLPEFQDPGSSTLFTVFWMM